MALTQSEDTYKSAWLISKSGESIFTYAKSRLYVRKKSSGERAEKKMKTNLASLEESNSLDVKLVLEPSPKWSVLHSLLEEIREKAKSPYWEEMISIGYGCKVLIMVKDSSTMLEVGEIITSKSAPSEYLRREFQKLKKNREEAISHAKMLISREVGDVESIDEQENGVELEENANLENVEKNKSFKEKVDIATASGTVSSDSIGLEMPDFQIVQLKQKYENWQGLKVLQLLRPRFVIIYEPMNALIRQLEVYQICHSSLPIEVFSLVYENSVEKEKFERSLRYESIAFEKLIRDKENMVLYIDDEECNRNERDDSSNRFGVVESNLVSRRSIGIRGKIYVDMREFRSKLPQLLYINGAELIPVTLTIGDYILSKSLFIERKSLADLTMSLKSGRLFSQVQNLCRYCRYPCILIEFPPGRSYILSSLSELMKELSPVSVLSRLVILTNHFPNLRIIWCHNEYFCSDLFAALKNTEVLDELPEIGSLLPNEKMVSEYDNYSAVDVLSQLPGISDRNIDRVLNKYDSIQELCNSALTDLEECLGTNNAKIFFDFIHAASPNVYEGQFK